MKSLSVSELLLAGRATSATSVYYSLIGRDYEWELRCRLRSTKASAHPASGRQLGWGRLNRQDSPRPAAPRDLCLHSKLVVDAGPTPDWEYVYKVVDALDEIAKETGKSIPQISLNWLLRRPTVSTLVIGARDEKQLRDNLASVDWQLTPEQIKRPDARSATEARSIPTGTRFNSASATPFPVPQTLITEA